MSGQRNSKEREQAVAEVVQSHRSRLLSVIERRIRDQAEAEDVLQEVYSEFLAAYDLGEAIETLSAWLFRVAQNKILDRFRKKKHERSYLDSVASTASEASLSAPGPEDERTRAWLRTEIVEALALLPSEQREVFVKHELEGKSFEDISKETGVGVNTLLSRKRYALKFLRSHLKEVYDALE